jgi:hypothetical protein
VPDRLRTICNEPTHAVGTKGDGPCAVHAVFGTPAQTGVLTKSVARDIVRHLLGSSFQSLLDRGAKEEHGQALQASFRTDLALVYLERTASEQQCIQDEPKLFWESLTLHSADVAADAKRHFERLLVTRRESVALKTSVLESSRVFCSGCMQCCQNAIDFGELPVQREVSDRLPALLSPPRIQNCIQFSPLKKNNLAMWTLGCWTRKKTASWNTTLGSCAIRRKLFWCSTMIGWSTTTRWCRSFARGT